MSKQFSRGTLAWVFLAAILGCSSRAHQDRSGPPSIISDGYACFRQQINPVGAVSSNFYCVFALETASTYFSATARAEKIRLFISSLDLTCEVSNSWEMEDPHRTHDHGLSLIVTAVRCK